jgi:hypothetical protein
MPLPTHVSDDTRESNSTTTVTMTDIPATTENDDELLEFGEDFKFSDQDVLEILKEINGTKLPPDIQKYTLDSHADAAVEKCMKFIKTHAS